METIIRYANKNDVDSIALVYSLSFQTAFKGVISDDILQGIFSFEKRREGLLRELSEGFPVNIIMEDKEKLLAMLTYGKSNDQDLDNSSIEILRIYVHPSYWRENLGHALMNWTLDELRQKQFNKVILWVIEDNVRARRFYEKMGFQHDGVTRIIDVGKRIKDLRYIKNINNG